MDNEDRINELIRLLVESAQTLGQPLRESERWVGLPTKCWEFFGSAKSDVSEVIILPISLN